MNDRASSVQLMSVKIRSDKVECKCNDLFKLLQKENTSPQEAASGSGCLRLVFSFVRYGAYQDDLRAAHHRTIHCQFQLFDWFVRTCSLEIRYGQRIR